MYRDPDNQFQRKKLGVFPPSLSEEAIETDRPCHDVRAIVGKGDWRARYIRGEDGGRKIQLWKSPALYQMEPSGRPDGERPEGRTNYVQYLNSKVSEKQARSPEWIRETTEALKQEIWLYSLRAEAFSKLLEFHKETPDLLAMVNACAWLVGIGKSDIAACTLVEMPDRIGRNCTKRLTSKITRTGPVARIASFMQSVDILQTVTELAEQCEPLLESAVLAAQREREKLLETLMPSTVEMVRRSLGAATAAEFRRHLERGEYREAARCYTDGQERKGKPPREPAYPEPQVHENAVDLGWITYRWPIDERTPQVRCLFVSGRQVLQEREPLGVSQFEVSGRPDRAHPRGHDTLLDYHVLRAISRAGRKRRKSDERLSADDAAALREEASLYWSRAAAWFTLGKWQAAAEDFSVCSRTMDYLAEHGYTADYLSWKTALDSAIARSNAWHLQRLKQGERALRTLEAALERVRLPEQDLEQEGYYSLPIERDHQTILNRQPANSPARLRRELEKAVKEEKYEDAAGLRDALAAVLRRLNREGSHRKRGKRSF